MPPTLIDVTAVPSDRRGVGRYIDEVLRVVPGDSISIACKPSDEDYYRRLAPDARVLAQRGTERVLPRLLWEQFLLPGVARRAGVSVIHSPHYTMPLMSRRARVVTFHDATFFSTPLAHTPLKRLFFAVWMRVSCRLARTIIVPSRATATELSRYLRKPIERFTVIHHGVDLETFAPPSPEMVRAAAADLGLPERWIAFLGTIEPRKNLPALIEAYSAVVQRWDPAWGAIPALSIAGGSGWGPPIDDDIARSEGSVQRLGYLRLSDVPAFLGGAILVVYPSLGEGFGLPVLEAMACGAAVLTTPRLALPEVGGDAVAYAEPDAAALAEGLIALLSSPAERRRLSSLARERAGSFDWNSCARAHLAVYVGAHER